MLRHIRRPILRNMEKVIDPLRHIEVPLTEEEKVRQWFISVLIQGCRVPVSVMKSEVGFKFGDKQYRADILVWDRNAKPLMVVECKKPSVKIDAKVLDQAIRYNMALDLKWLVLTNGTNTVVLRKDDGMFMPTNELPCYECML